MPETMRDQLPSFDVGLRGPSIPLQRGTDMTRIPPAALLLAVGGLIPLVWASLLILGIVSGGTGVLPAVLEGDGTQILIRYGGMILAFMSGILFGFAVAAPTVAQANAAFFLAAIPPVWWFLMPGADVQSTLVNLALGFVGVLALDLAFYRWDLTPPWWLQFRIPIIVVTLASLSIGIWF